MDEVILTRETLRQLLIEELPDVIREYPNVRYSLIGVMAETFARQSDIQSILQHLDALREDFNRQMAEFARQQNRFMQRIESHIGALGARWGLMAEEAFRTGLAGILDERLGLRVERFWQMDTAGQVFGRPDQVEIDVVLHNGDHWLMELKSSISRGEVYLFERKVAFYEEARGVKAKRKIIISPMVERGAEKVAASLGIEVYTSAYEFEP